MENLKKLDKAGDILNQLSIFNNIENSHLKNYTQVFNSWEKIVGKKLAGYSRIKELDKNSLIIEADHPSIIQLLQLNYKRTLKKLNVFHSELDIKDIRIFLKDPQFDYNISSTSLPLKEDNELKQRESKKDLNFENIEDGNFKDILMKMNKRT